MTVFETSGNKLLADGVELQLHGVNFIGFETVTAAILGLWSDKTIDEFLDHIKRRGFNTLRIPLGRKTFENNIPAEGSVGIWSGSKNEKILKGKRSLEILDMVIDGCERRGLYYYLDNHTTIDGKIQPLWYHEGYSERQWIDDNVLVASRFRGRKGFIGIDTKNEPGLGNATWGGDARTDFKAANERLYQEISRVNPDIILIIETLNAGGSVNDYINNPINVPKNKVAYSPHIYFIDVWTGDGWALHGLDQPNLAQALPQHWDRYFGDAGQNHCIIIGEHGGFARPGSRDRECQQLFVEYLKRRGILNHTYWCWQKDSHDTSGIVTDDSYTVEDAFKLENLAKLRTPFARYSTDAAPPRVTPPAVPTPPPPVTPPKPVATGDIKPGDKVQLITRDGPKMVVVSLSTVGTALCVSAYGQVSIHLKYLVKV